MELEGMIVFDLPKQEGVSQAGRPWKKKEWVIETPGAYPKRVKFTVFGDRADFLTFEVGKSYAITIELESREYNGRWYTDVNCMGARPLDGGNIGNFGETSAPGFGQPAPVQQTQAPAQQVPPVQQTPTSFANDNNTDDLPF